MKCKLCDKFFIKEINFLNLFEIHEICDECKLTFQPEIQFEAIPIENGLIEYYYLYDDVLMNRKQITYLSSHLHMLYRQAEGCNANVILIVTEENADCIKNNLKLLIGFQKIMFMSLSRINFDDCVVFY